MRSNRNQQEELGSNGQAPPPPRVEQVPPLHKFNGGGDCRVSSCSSQLKKKLRFSPHLFQPQLELFSCFTFKYSQKQMKIICWFLFSVDSWSSRWCWRKRRQCGVCPTTLLNPFVDSSLKLRFYLGSHFPNLIPECVIPHWVSSRVVMVMVWALWGVLSMTLLKAQPWKTWPPQPSSSHRNG